MVRGLAISLLAHVSVLAWALISIHAAELPKLPVVEAIAVSIVTPDEITRVTKGDRNAKLLEAQPVDSKAAEEQNKELPKPKPKAAVEPPPPPPEPAPEPKQAEAPPPAPEPPPPPKPDPIAEKMAALANQPPPEPKPDPGPTPDEVAAQEAARKAEEQRKVEEEKRKAEEKQKAEELKKKKLAEAKKKREEAARKKREAEAKRKKEFDADKLAALLNKIPDAGGPKPAAEAPRTPTTNRGPVAGAPDGRDNRLTASELALLGAMIKRGVQPCWRVLGGGQGADATAVRMRIQFNQDGTLRGDPQIINPQANPFFIAAADSAKRAVIQCQPYNLPAEKYVAWQDVILNFEPRDMF